MKNSGLIRKRFKTVTVVAGLILLFAVSAYASGGGHGDEGTKGWIETDTWRVMNFSVLAIGLFLLLRKPVSQSLDNRIKGIREQLSDLEAKKTDAEKKVAEYNERLARLQQEEEKIIAEYIRQGNDAKIRILEEAKLAAVKLEEQAKRSIEYEFNQAKLKLQAEIVEKAVVKAEESLKSTITLNDQDRLVDEYLQKVVAQ